jgi:hypothetical protein
MNSNFGLTKCPLITIHAAMNATITLKDRWCWRKDLAGFRGLTEKERAGFLLVLEWSRKGLRPTRL